MARRGGGCPSPLANTSPSHWAVTCRSGAVPGRIPRAQMPKGPRGSLGSLAGVVHSQAVHERPGTPVPLQTLRKSIETQEVTVPVLAGDGAAGETGSTGGSSSPRAGHLSALAVGLCQPIQAHVSPPTPTCSRCGGEREGMTQPPQSGMQPSPAAEPCGPQQKLDHGGGCWGDRDGSSQCLGAISLPIVAELLMATSFPRLSAKASPSLPAVTSLSSLESW